MYVRICPSPLHNTSRRALMSRLARLRRRVGLYTATLGTTLGALAFAPDAPAGNPEKEEELTAPPSPRGLSLQNMVNAAHSQRRVYEAYETVQQWTNAGGSFHMPSASAENETLAEHRRARSERGLSNLMDHAAHPPHLPSAIRPTTAQQQADDRDAYAILQREHQLFNGLSTLVTQPPREVEPTPEEMQERARRREILQRRINAILRANEPAPEPAAPAQDSAAARPLGIMGRLAAILSPASGPGPAGEAPGWAGHGQAADPVGGPTGAPARDAAYGTVAGGGAIGGAWIGPEGGQGRRWILYASGITAAAYLIASQTRAVSAVSQCVTDAWSATCALFSGDAAPSSTDGPAEPHAPPDDAGMPAVPPSDAARTDRTSASAATDHPGSITADSPERMHPISANPFATLSESKHLAKFIEPADTLCALDDTCADPASPTSNASEDATLASDGVPPQAPAATSGELNPTPPSPAEQSVSDETQRDEAETVPPDTPQPESPQAPDDTSLHDEPALSSAPPEASEMAESLSTATVVEDIAVPLKPVLISPAVGAYAANAWAANTMFELNLLDHAYPGAAGSSDPAGAWATYSGARSGLNDKSGVLRTHGDKNSVLFGFDLLTRPLADDRQVKLGVFGGYGHYHGSTRSKDFAHATRGRVDGNGIGLYAAYLNRTPERQGVYLNNWVLWNHFTTQVNHADAPADRYDAKGVTASSELGFRFKLADHGDVIYALEPRAQIIYQNVRSPAGRRVGDTRIDVRDAARLQTRVGVRLTAHIKTGPALTLRPHIEATVMHTNKGYAVRMDDVTTHMNAGRNAAQIKLGVQGDFNRNLSLDLALFHTSGNRGFSEKGGNLVARYRF